MFEEYKKPDYYIGKQLKWSDGYGQIVEFVTDIRPVTLENSTDFILVQRGLNDPERAIRVDNDFIDQMKLGGYPNHPFPKAYLIIGGTKEEIGYASLWNWN